MSEEKNLTFKCGNELKVNIKKETGEVLMDEECCTYLSIILKNDGQLATSFLGSHNPQVVKILEKTLKGYFKVLKKTLKQAYKDGISQNDIEVHKDEENPNNKPIETKEQLPNPEKQSKGIKSSDEKTKKSTRKSTSKSNK